MIDAQVMPRHKDAATRALGKRPTMEPRCDCCGRHYDQEYRRLSQALANQEAELSAKKVYKEPPSIYFGDD